MKTILKNNSCSATILHQGAELFEFTKDKTNYIWTIDKQFWNKTSPVLFPIVGRLKNDSYTLNGKEYTLPRHGFARNFVFKVLEKNENSVIFSLQENEATLTVFPFKFELQIQYVLENNSLSIIYTVFNNSKEKMPFTIGAHPAFAVPNNFKDYSLQFNTNEILNSHILTNDLFSGKTIQIPSVNGKIPLQYDLFDNDALVFKNIKSKEVTLLYQNNPYLKVRYDDFNHLGIWTKPNAPFLCIEPWQGHADASSTIGNIYIKEAIQILNSKESYKCRFSIKVY